MSLLNALGEQANAQSCRRRAGVTWRRNALRRLATLRRRHSVGRLLTCHRQKRNLNAICATKASRRTPQSQLSSERINPIITIKNIYTTKIIIYTSSNYYMIDTSMQKFVAGKHSAVRS